MVKIQRNTTTFQFKAGIERYDRLQRRINTVHASHRFRFLFVIFYALKITDIQSKAFKHEMLLKCFVPTRDCSGQFGKVTIS